ncbi:MAG: TIGR01906 family membrane protein [Clostridiales bacterium]|nr:TIGR01906 family membrane protein [Clostridiales bacterium]
MPAKEGKRNAVLAAAAGFLLVLFILLAALQGVAGNKAFFEKQFALADENGQDAYQRTRMEQDEFWRVTDALLDYLFGRSGTLQTQAVIGGASADVYSEREILHMADVQKLMKGATAAKWLALGLGLFLLLYVFFFTKGRLRVAVLCRGYLRGIAAFFVLALGIGTFALADFEGFFTLFHRIFFSNDLWILSADDFLIRLVPQMFFENFVARMGLIFGLTVLISGLLVWLFHIFWKKRGGDMFTFWRKTGGR